MTSHVHWPPFPWEGLLLARLKLSPMKSRQWQGDSELAVKW